MAKRTAFVTGASYGVGAATALALAREGCDVAVSATKAENLDATVAKLAAAGVRAIPLVLDLRSQASIEHAMTDVLAAFGQLDVLINNAGADLRKLAVDVSWAEWDAVMATNLRGTFFLTQQAGRHLIAIGRAGAIVNIASTHGLIGAAERSTYGISKGALIQMTRMLAIEWAPHNIRVNAVAPTTVMTESRQQLLSDPKARASALSRIPSGRFATPEEVAAAVVYLASAAAGSVTGHTLTVDGGLTAQ
jgi:NAD(P)-dependent dehydrogenase (short-subunit alcohol dehydrogenase family)